VSDLNYLQSEDQKRIRRRLLYYGDFILARYEQGYTPKEISHLLSVSEESVRSRIRKENMFSSCGKPGRPKKQTNSP
jgi:hypothetical protein